MRAWIFADVIIGWNIAWVVANEGSCGLWQRVELMKRTGWSVLKCSVKLGCWCSWRLWVLVGSLLYNPDWYCCRWFAVQHAGCIVISICVAVAYIGKQVVVLLWHCSLWYRCTAPIAIVLTSHLHCCWHAWVVHWCVELLYVLMKLVVGDAHVAVYVVLYF
jgi:hypothetical protein